MDLAAYLERIGWRGDTAPTRATLAGLLAAHMRAIPFENLDVLLGRPIALDLPALERKLVHASRGGYCFEHVTLFAHVLEALGFQVRRHLARVTLFVPLREAPRTHMFLVVQVEDTALVLDPGFGGPASPVPMPLTGHASAATHWMELTGHGHAMCTSAGAAWVSELGDDLPVDFEVANHFTATHPGSVFRNRLMMSRFTMDGRVSVLDCDATIRDREGTCSLRLPDRSALRTFLVERFGFDLPEVETLFVPAIESWSRTAR